MGAESARALRLLGTTVVAFALGGVGCSDDYCFTYDDWIVGCEGGSYTTAVDCHVDAQLVDDILERSTDFEAGYGPFDEWSERRQCAFVCVVNRNPATNLPGFGYPGGVEWDPYDSTEAQYTLDARFPGNAAWEEEYEAQNPRDHLGEARVIIEVCELEWLPGGEATVACDLRLEREICYDRDTSGSNRRGGGCLADSYPSFD